MRKISLKKRLTHKEEKSQRNKVKSGDTPDGIVSEKKKKTYSLDPYICFINNLRWVSITFMNFLINRNCCFSNSYFIKPPSHWKSSRTPTLFRAKSQIRPTPCSSCCCSLNISIFQWGLRRSRPFLTQTQCWDLSKSVGPKNGLKLCTYNK